MIMQVVFVSTAERAAPETTAHSVLRTKKSCSETDLVPLKQNKADHNKVDRRAHASEVSRL